MGFLEDLFELFSELLSDGAEAADGMESIADDVEAATNATEASADSAETTIIQRTPQVRFGETVTFPDGTVVENPHRDALNQAYKTRSDWLGGNDPHVTD